MRTAPLPLFLFCLIIASCTEAIGNSPPVVPAGPVMPTENGSQPYATEFGARVPWISYEAEHGSYRGSLIGPSRELHTIAAEASGRMAVRLAGQNDYIEWTATQAANSIVIRYCIPDAPGGGGMSSTISLYVNGSERQDINLSSKHSWLYGASNDPGALVNTPSATARMFFTESHALVGNIPRGATVRLQIDADNNADYYIIDFIDLEDVEDPIPKPSGALSISDYGAIPNDNTDDAPAIRAAIAAAGSAGIVYIPEGRFIMRSKVSVHGQTIQGAGMWYSRFHSPDDVNNSGRLPGNFGFKMTRGSKFYDLAFFSNGGKKGKRWKDLQR